MKVSVKMITYNHAKYIKQAIDSVLMQETDFPYELVIGEDCSTDGTREIVVDYQQRHPDKIRLLLSEQNLGMHENARRTRQACLGQYVALLEGDDYWTSPYKLQKQVDFLDSHPECAMCYHDVFCVYEGESRERMVPFPGAMKEISSLEDLLQRNFVPTCSVVFRNGLIDEFPDWYYELAMGDWPLHILNAQHGKIGYINHVMGAYRIHPGGTWSQLDPIRKLLADVELFEFLNAHFHFRYDDLIRTRISVAWGGAAAEMIERAAQPAGAHAALAATVNTYREWSRGLAVPAARKAQILGHIYAGSFFASHRIHATAMTRHCFLKATQYERSWLRNWGVWSILLEAFLGRRIASFLRRKAQPIGRRSVE